jgi:C-terminal processing protease CtpA/Prc
MATISSTLGALALAVALAAPVAGASAADAAPSDSTSREQLEKRLHEAQQELERAAQRVAELSVSLSDEIGPQLHHFAHPGSRAMIGIGIDMDASRVADRHGVRVMSVSPGGPADTAGIKANDVIVSFAGKAVTGGEERSAPEQLLSAIREAKPGQPVAIEYRRDGKTNKAQIVPKSMADSFAEVWQPFDEMPMPDLHRLPHVRPFPFMMHDDANFGSAELVELSPQLGQYFGVDKGLLVVHAPRDERLKLKDGDVILDIDGRAPSSVSHAFQILSSYRAGETLKLHVMRQQKRIELSIEIPGSPPSTAAPSQPAA